MNKAIVLAAFTLTVSGNPVFTLPTPRVGACYTIAAGDSSVEVWGADKRATRFVVQPNISASFAPDSDGSDWKYVGRECPK